MLKLSIKIDNPLYPLPLKRGRGSPVYPVLGRDGAVSRGGDGKGEFMIDKQYVINEIAASESWRMFHIMAEFVEGFEALGK
jgi:hypothetical protein